MADPPSRRNARTPRKDRVWADLIVAGALTLAGGLAAVALPDGSGLRLALTLPLLLLVPGYLLLQAILVPAAPPRTRLLHAAIALGLSPAISGLLALATSLVPGGFVKGMILMVLMGACLALGALAGWRRIANPAADPSTLASPVPAAEPDAAEMDAA